MMVGKRVSIMETSELTVARYKEALVGSRSKISNKQYSMLQAHYIAPNRTITANELARAVGYSKFSAANSQYGRLGRILCEALGHHPSRRDDGSYRWWTVQADGVSPEDGRDFQWVMRPELARAIEELAWFAAQRVPPNGESRDELRRNNESF